MTANSSLLNKLTLIIPTYNRHSYLRRILNYYKNYNFEKIIIDSSENKFPLRNEFDITYLHYPGINPPEKPTKVIDIIETPYVSQCADDDFIIPNAIKQCIEFLERKSNYHSAQGKFVRFAKNKIRIPFFWKGYSYLNDINYDINGNTPEKRLMQFTTIYCPLSFAIHRVNTIIDTFSMKNIYLGRLAEIALAIVAVINGKHRMFPILYCAREKSSISLGSTDRSPYELIKDPSLKRENDLFIEDISNHLASKYNYPYSISREYIEKAMKNYFYIYRSYNINYYNKEQEELATRKKWAFSNIRNINFSLLRLFSQLFPKIFNNFMLKSSYQSLESPSLKPYSNLSKIKKCIFHYPIKS